MMFLYLLNQEFTPEWPVGSFSELLILMRGPLAWITFMLMSVDLVMRMSLTNFTTLSPITSNVFGLYSLPWKQEQTIQITQQIDSVSIL